MALSINTPAVFSIVPSPCGALASVFRMHLNLHRVSSVCGNIPSNRAQGQAWSYLLGEWVKTHPSFPENSRILRLRLLPQNSGKKEAEEE